MARAFTIGGALLLAGFFPGFLVKVGTVRIHPLDLRQAPRADGSIDVRQQSEKTGSVSPMRVVAIAVGTAPWLPPGSLTIFRDLQSLPVHTPLGYRVAKEAVETEVAGEVLERRETTGRIISTAIRALVALVLTLAGIALAVAAADRRGALAGASLAGLGGLLGSVFLEPALVQLRNFPVRNAATTVWQLYPRDFAAYFLVKFLEVFPGRISASRSSRLIPFLLLAGGVASSAGAALAQIPGALDSWLPVAGQVFVIRTVRFLKPAVVVLGGLYAIRLIWQQRRLYRRLALARADRPRARWLGWALVAAIAPALAAIVAQTALIMLSGRKVISTPWISFAFAPLLLVPITLAYVLLTRDSLSLRLLVHRARLFGFSEKTVRVVAIIPLAVLLLFLYIHRDAQMTDLLKNHPLFIGLTGGAAALSLLYRDRMRRALEGVFFRDREDARRLMGELAEKSRAAKDPASLEELLSREIGRALHAESVALFVRDGTSGTFVCPSRSLPTLDVDAMLVGAAGTRGVLDLDPADRRSPLATLSEIERHWVEESHARLLLPLSGADGTVIGLLTVGENLSELPWDKEDKSLLVAAAASGALALENCLLRSSGGAGAMAIRPAATHEEEDLARSCHLCSQMFSSALGPLCPKDQVPLTVAGVPHVLAGKYRFERRIGSGGMGVVYLARDLSLGRFVAVKTLPKVSPEAAMRLRREARATARVLHPNLAVIFAAETWHGTPMLMLEYLEGGTLAPRIARGPIPIGRVVEWGIALSDALEAAHAKGVLHRDIKPSNIGFTASGEPKLLDFGLASLLEEPELLAAVETATKGLDMLETAELKHMTVSGRIVGTLPYLAPEAILGETPQVSFDLWSLALTLYEATTGSNPFLEMPAEKTLNRILSQTPPRARTLRADCPEELSELFASALARKPAERLRSAREFHRALRRLASALAA